MKKMFLLSAALLCAAICLTSLSFAQAPDQGSLQGNATQPDVLRAYATENLSQSLIQGDLGFMSMTQFFNFAGLDVSEMAKFTAPRPGWTLTGVSILGYDMFNGTPETVPADRTIAIEIRDQDLNLLYRFTDSQRPYFNLAKNLTAPSVASIDFPPVAVTEEFYVCFYDRGAILIGAELSNATNNSFIFNRGAGELYPAEVPQTLEANSTLMPVNWVIRAIGY